MRFDGLSGSALLRRCEAGSAARSGAPHSLWRRRRGAAARSPVVWPRRARRFNPMIHFVLLISRQGKVRLTKWYSPYSAKEKSRAVREVSAVVLSRQQKQCNFLEYKDKKIIYKRYAAVVHASSFRSLTIVLLVASVLCRYASLYFLACVLEKAIARREEFWFEKQNVYCVGQAGARF